MTNTAAKKLLLCSGLQSGGTSIISWCFLQRADTDGVFDMENSTIHTDFSLISTENTWVKMTIGSFRTAEVASIYSDMGFEVMPLLVIRDVRYAFSSLIDKVYGINGNTAEDPPLRLRYRRFLQDWTMFRDNGWPIILFEKFVQNPELELRNLTESLNLQWDGSMLNWPKSEESISYLSPGNETFHQSRINNQGLKGALLGNKATSPVKKIAEADLAWLEETFRQYNTVNGYPEHLTNMSGDGPGHQIPEIEDTRRKKINELNAEYWRVKSNLNRIRNHAIFGTIIRLWSRFVNRNFRVFE